MAKIINSKKKETRKNIKISIMGRRKAIRIYLNFDFEEEA